MIIDKIKTLWELVQIRNDLRQNNKKVVFTNGVFDILHRGHVEYLEQASCLGDVLMLGLNSDVSVRLVKGEGRPIVKQDDRATILAGLQSVDYICFFDEETPTQIIAELLPDILVKGGDYQIGEIVGSEVVQANGGKVVTIPLIKGHSTTDMIGKIIKLFKEGILPA